MNRVEILLIVAVGIAVSAAARRRGIEPGLVIVVLAAAASFVPGVPRLELESELIPAIVVPPLLYSAARGGGLHLGANVRTGRDAIQAIALIVTPGTLLIQGTTLQRLIRTVAIDPASEAATAVEMHGTGAGIVAATDPDDYAAQRTGPRPGGGGTASRRADRPRHDRGDRPASGGRGHQALTGHRCQ
jgi:NhaP-type Na+/H+ or K+/H+ antiporter